MKTARIYVFGDSITYGAWDSQGGWCDRLKRKLHQLKISSSEIKFQLFNLGIGGETSRSLLLRFRSEINARHRTDWPAVVLIATGANDIRSENDIIAVEVTEYRANLDQLLKIAREYTDKILFVGLAPVEHESQQFKGTTLSNQLLKEYDQVMGDLATANNIPKVDIFENLQQSMSPIHSVDGVHPNDTGHEIIEKLVWNKLEKLLFN